MADGLTNEAVAERVFLSTKSVESVVRSIFLKLGLVDNQHNNRRVLAVRMFLDSSSTFGEQWPSWPSSFVGRRTELGELAVLVDSPRLVTVLGLGGIGKTRATAELVSQIITPATGFHFVDQGAVDCGV